MKIIIYGACGRMGKELEKLIASSDIHSVAARADKFTDEKNCYKNIGDFTGEADMIIDFSNHLAAKELTEYAVKRNIPIVISTTGHNKKELEMIKAASKKIAVFHSANMSLGVALLCELAVKTAAVMTDADIEIIETHHNRKLDAPSGTALMLAETIKSVRSKAFFRIGRKGNQKRENEEIGIHAVRRGNLVGIHEVIISTDSQTITLKHEAHSRTIFAEGAISAAEFLINKPAGLYGMNNIIE